VNVVKRSGLWEPFRPQDWVVEEIALTRDTGYWIDREINLQEGFAWRGGHDEGTFTYSWFPFYLLTGNRRIMAFLEKLKQDCLHWMRRTGSMLHGYWKDSDVHHGTELFTNFLAQYLRFGRDRDVIRAFVDVAHHAGNWVEGVPDWYDWERKRFRSERLGTQRVDCETPSNVPAHFRMVQILLETYLATGDERYLKLGREYVDEWSAVILDRDVVPFYLDDPEEREIRGQRRSVEYIVEEHVANNTINILMDLYIITGEKRYIKSVKKMLNPILTRVSDPNNNASSTILAKYRALAGDRSLDQKVVESLKVANEEFEAALMILDSEWRRKPHPLGIGRRRDEPQWAFRRRDGSIVADRWSSPAHLMLAFWITGDTDLAAQAFWKAKLRLRLAMWNLRSGRWHGCAAGSVSSVVAGHGRCLGAGNVTATLYPAVFGGYQFLGGFLPQLIYYRENDVLGVPEGVAALFSPTRRENEAKVLFYNCNETPIKMGIELTSGRWDDVTPEFENIKKLRISGSKVTVLLPPRELGGIRYVLPSRWAIQTLVRGRVLGYLCPR